MIPKKKMNNLTTTWNREDRDLLVELRTEMKGVRGDIQDLSDGNNVRLTLLEQGKLDRTEANRLQSESLDVHTKLDTRITTLEESDRKTSKYFWLIGTLAGSIGAVFLAVIQGVVGNMKI